MQKLDTCRVLASLRETSVSSVARRWRRTRWTARCRTTTGEAGASGEGGAQIIYSILDTNDMLGYDPGPGSFGAVSVNQSDTGVQRRGSEVM